MSYQIIAPVVMPINASSYKDAVKQYVKLHRDASINQLIVADQLTNNKMLANIKYYQFENRRKFRADLVPTTLSELNGGMVFAPPAFIGTDPYGYPISPVPVMRRGGPMMMSGPIGGPMGGPMMGGPIGGPMMGGPGLVRPMMGGPGLVRPMMGGPIGGPMMGGPGLVGPMGVPMGVPIGGPMMMVGSPTPVTPTPGTVLPLGVKIMRGSTILSSTIFPQGTVLPDGTNIDSISNLPNGVLLPVGTNITSGTLWTPGAVMPSVTVALGAGLVPGSTITLSAGSLIPVGAVLPSGTNLSPTLALPDGGPGTGINDRVNIPSGFNLSAGNTIINGSIFPNGTAMQGSTINNTTFFDTGTQISLGTTIKKDCVFPLGTIIPNTANLPLGTTIKVPLGTLDINIGSGGPTGAQLRLMYFSSAVGFNLNNVTLKAGFVFSYGSVIVPGTIFPATSELTLGTEIMGPTQGSTGMRIMPAPRMIQQVPINIRPYRSMSPPSRYRSRR